MVAGTKHAYDPASDSAPRELTRLVIPVVSGLTPNDATEEDDPIEVNGEEQDAAADSIEDNDAATGIAIPPALKRAMDHLARKGTPIYLDGRSDAPAPGADA